MFRNIVVSGNGEDGIQTNGRATIERTVVSANARSGIFVVDPGTAITDSAILGNADSERVQRPSGPSDES